MKNITKKEKEISKDWLVIYLIFVMTTTQYILFLFTSFCKEMFVKNYGEDSFNGYISFQYGMLYLLGIFFIIAIVVRLRKIYSNAKKIKD